MAEFEHEDFDYDDLNEIKTFLELWKERFPDSWINNTNNSIWFGYVGIG